MEQATGFIPRGLYYLGTQLVDYASQARRSIPSMHNKLGSWRCPTGFRDLFAVYPKQGCEHIRAIERILQNVHLPDCVAGF